MLIIEEIIKQWDSVDSNVRSTAITMIQYMCQVEMRAMKSYMANDSNTSSLLMTEITKRLNDPSYLDKENLSKLLSWYFAHQ